MPQTISPSSGVTAIRIGLDGWMHRTLIRADLAAESFDEESVHDLRVALRRCRTMADALSQINPHPSWRKIKKSSRDLFRALGGLRDVQVERESAKRISSPGDPLRSALLRKLAQREKEHRELARKELEKFDRKGWKKLSRKVERKTRLFPTESIVFQRLALAKLAEASTLFDAARKRRSGVAWHHARIGLKQFRYISENFLPRRYEQWAADLKRLQDLLGEVHDLDVLRSDMRLNAHGIDPAIVIRWREKIQMERKTRLDVVSAKIFGRASLLAVWRGGFSLARPVAAAPLLSQRSA